MRDATNDSNDPAHAGGRSAGMRTNDIKPVTQETKRMKQK